MTLDDIPPNKTITLTKLMNRLFRLDGCDPPSCHACYKQIKVGQKFKLETCDGYDVMLCPKHTVEDYKKEIERPVKLSPIPPWPMSGGYIRPTQAARFKDD